MPRFAAQFRLGLCCSVSPVKPFAPSPSFPPGKEIHMTDDQVIVATVQGQFAEGQLRSFLEAAGIPTAVRGESLRATHGLSIDGLGAVQILVPREREEEARALIAAADSGALRLLDDGQL